MQDETRRHLPTVKQSAMADQDTLGVVIKAVVGAVATTRSTITRTWPASPLAAVPTQPRTPIAVECHTSMAEAACNSIRTHPSRLGLARLLLPQCPIMERRPCLRLPWRLASPTTLRT